MANNSVYNAKIILLLLLVVAGVSLCNYVAASDRYSTPPPAPAPTINNYNVIPVGVAIAGASGSCVKDWKPGWQKCLAWAMVDVDVEGDDDTVHAFGGGVTTRVDQFAIHFFGGFENFGTDEEAILFTGSVNWR
jgi:hypothetical protein